MKYLLLIPIIAFVFIPSKVEAITGQEETFRHVYGVPAVVADTSNNCTDTARIRYAHVYGVPTQVLDSTATCTAPVASGGGTKQDVIWFE